MLVHHSEVYRQAADPANDEGFRQRAVAAYKKLKSIIEEGKKVFALFGDSEDNTTAIGFEVQLEPTLLVYLMTPDPDKPDVGGSFARYRFQPGGVITMYLGATEEFWAKPVEEQLEQLPYVIISPVNFVHEYVHYLDNLRGVKLRGQRQRQRGEKRPDYNNMSTKDFIKYLSDGSEFNAWYQSMVQQVIDEREYTIELFKKIPSHRATLPTWINNLQEFVNHSWWKFLNLSWHVDILPAKFERKIKKRLAQTFQHLQGESEVSSPVGDKQLNNALRDSRESFWEHMNQHVVGYDGYEKPEAMAKRFQESYRDESNFLEKFADDIRFRSIPDMNAHTLEPLTSGQKLKLKSTAREVYKELEAERDFLVAEGRKKEASVRHNGEVYRHALTPEQKDRKKGYLLQQNLQGRKGIPTWEEVREMIDNTYSDEHGYRVEYAEEDPGLDYKVDELVGRVFGNHPLVTKLRQRSSDDLEDVLDQYLQDDWDGDDIRAALKKANLPFKEIKRPKDFYYLAGSFREWAAEEMVMDQYQERYEDLVHLLKVAPPMQFCYRMLSLPENVDPASLDGLGVYWSMDEDKVGLYVHDEEQAERRPVNWRFTASVDYKYVDLWETVMHYMNPDYGPNEDEVRWFKHAPILVHNAEEILGYDKESHGPTLKDAYGYDTGRFIEIEAMRRC